MEIGREHVCTRNAYFHVFFTIICSSLKDSKENDPSFIVIADSHSSFTDAYRSR